MSRYWFDTEFIEKPCTIDLISIGIVSDTGRTFYAESTEVHWSAASPWVQENVRPHLSFDFPDHHRFFSEEDVVTEMAAPKNEIGRAIREWVDTDNPEFWAYYADYDWVAFCWLQGTMMDLPHGWPMFCRDVKQLAVGLGSPQLPEVSEIEHHALADALWTRDAWMSLHAAAGSVGVDGT